MDTFTAVRRAQVDGGSHSSPSTTLLKKGSFTTYPRVRRGCDSNAGSGSLRKLAWCREVSLRPPGFLVARRSALSEAWGSRYTTRLRTFKDLVTGRETISHSLVWSVRSAWRRVASLCWNGLLARRLFGAPLLRIGLHPVDWQHGAVRRQALHLVRSALAAREAITYEGWLARLRSEQ